MDSPTQEPIDKGLVRAAIYLHVTAGIIQGAGMIIVLLYASGVHVRAAEFLTAEGYSQLGCKEPLALLTICVVITVIFDTVFLIWQFRKSASTEGERSALRKELRKTHRERIDTPLLVEAEKKTYWIPWVALALTVIGIVMTAITTVQGHIDCSLVALNKLFPNPLLWPTIFLVGVSVLIPWLVARALVHEK